MGRRLLILSACALLLAGCGGKKHGSGKVYNLAPTVNCLRAHGFAVSTKQKDVNFIAFSAPEGGLRARKGDTDLIVAFGNSSDDRHQILLGVQRFAQQAPIFRHRIGRANVVMMWAYRPSEASEKLVIGCLNSSVGQEAGR
jgi:hypothetical protein